MREAAISGLVALKGHDADAILIAALERPDYPVIIAVARALRQSPHADRAVPALLAAFARLTGQQRDTSRAPRVALLERIGELGSADHAGAIVPYTQDFDPRVAALAATLVGKWTGRQPPVSPRPLPVERARLDEVERLGTAVEQVLLRRHQGNLPACRAPSWSLLTGLAAPSGLRLELSGWSLLCYHSNYITGGRGDMISVGIKELKEKLSGYVDKARLGEEIVVTDRGKEVALLIPVSRDRKAVRHLVESGKATWTGGKPAGMKGIKAKGGLLSKTVLEDRR